jgi:hypothetical protein
MNRVLLSLLALLVLAFVALPNTAHAYLITVNFAVTGDAADPLHGSDTGSGSFSFDSSLIPSSLPGGPSDTVNGLDVTSLDFTWAGHTYSTADADVYALSFDSSGKLTGFALGGSVNGLTGIAANVDDFRMNAAGWMYTYPGAVNVWGFPGDILEVNWTVDYGQAPEPGSLALVAPFLALGLIRRRRR